LKETKVAGELIPIIMFIVLGIITLGYFYWNHRNRQAVMDTVQKAIETGGEFSPELLSQLGAAVNPRARDLRRGVIFLALGIAGLLCSLFFDNDTRLDVPAAARRWLPASMENEQRLKVRRDDLRPRAGGARRRFG
jgi:hypothetical protein